MKLLTQLVREILHLSGKGQEISKTFGCGNHVFLLIHRNDQFTLCIYVTYHYKRQLINSKLETFASEYLNVKMININSQHSPKCDLISFGLFRCFLSLYFFRTGINATADAFPVVASRQKFSEERIDDRKCVCCSQAMQNVNCVKLLLLTLIIWNSHGKKIYQNYMLNIYSYYNMHWNYCMNPRAQR